MSTCKLNIKHPQNLLKFKYQIVELQPGVDPAHEEVVVAEEGHLQGADVGEGEDGDVQGDAQRVSGGSDREELAPVVLGEEEDVAVLLVRGVRAVVHQVAALVHADAGAVATREVVARAVVVDAVGQGQLVLRVVLQLADAAVHFPVAAPSRKETFNYNCTLNYYL